MSVVNPRPAAAQRTAARVLVTWLFVVPLLTFFSFTVVAGAQTFAKPDLAKAVKQLPNDKHVVEVKVDKPKSDGGKDGSGNQTGLIEQFSHGDKVVCSVTGSQLVRIQQRYSTGRISLNVRGQTIDIVEVYGADDHDLRTLLSDQGVKCVLVRVESVFFLPFDPHGS